MAIYAIGDVQGCYAALRRLLDKCHFDPARDRLWLVGDLVNRGPHSLAVLRFVKSLGRRAVTVLGNHDLHLLVVAAGHAPQRHGDTLNAILRAPDRDELLHWLRHQKLLHVCSGHAMVHAGLLPQWSLKKALVLAREVELALQGDAHDEFLRHMYGNKPERWRDNLRGFHRLRVITGCVFARRRGALSSRIKAIRRHCRAALCLGLKCRYAVAARHRSSSATGRRWACAGTTTYPVSTPVASGDAS